METSGQFVNKLAGLEHGWRPAAFPQGYLLHRPGQTLDVCHPGQQPQVPRREGGCQGIQGIQKPIM